MSKETQNLQIVSSPHLASTAGTRRMMIDVIIALLPCVATALFVFREYAEKQLFVCILSALLAELIFNGMRSRPVTLGDFSALVTGLILGLSLPGTAPWYVGFIAAFMAIGLGKTVFGGLGQNLFNPAMVGRAFVMIAFPAVLGASAYQMAAAPVDAVTMATPLTALKQLGQVTPLPDLLLGTTNGSLGETSAIACLIGGLYLCLRRTAAWEIPAGAILAVAVICALFQPALLLQHLLGGAFLFGAFFIATDPVSSPVTRKGRWIFGAGFGALVMVLRGFSGYPEGVMFAVLIMNGLTPLINRGTIPVPVGGKVPERK